ncbi:polysaccharide deacetylase family protein [Pseudonocardia sp. H11422]|uniref:polysaccharide deacetylase family protein n=1 Tax=Pseudonocardia sp. H11422 TaxID=2835866 RepID=UPI001BDC521A|nr:polysaccharide deacetylase family protein [Pseudonocardia sp. H11422]
MTLVVEAPIGYEAERRYIFDVVLSDWLGLDWRLQQRERPDIRISLPEVPGERCVVLPDVLFGADPRDWLTAASLPSAGLRRVPVGVPGAVSDTDRKLPVIYGARSPSPARLVSSGPQGARLAVDVFGSAFFMLTRYEEVVLPHRDAYDRFPAASSLAAQEGFLTFPIVDAYVEILWAALVRVWPRLRRRHRDFAVLLTHDVDDPLATLGRGPAQVARQFAADLALRRDLDLTRRRVRALAAARRGDHDPDPHNTFDLLMEVSERNGIRSAFYFQAQNGVDLHAGATYPLDHPWIRRLLGVIHRRDHEVGYHAGFGTYLDAGRTRSEFDHLRAVAEASGVRQESWGGRQHYLQWATPVTWLNWCTAGLAYDCTVAYADAVGFRTGTCHEYRVFDLLERRPVQLRERPFQIMDVTLSGYMSLTPDAATAAIMDIAAQCRRFRGSLGILWHNDSLRTAQDKRWYESVVGAVAGPG